MTKPNDIPQDVWDKAHDTSLLLVVDLETNIETIARAIIAAKEEEREECAKIADGVPETVRGFYEPGTVITIWSVTSAISAAIRNRKLANNTNKD